MTHDIMKFTVFQMDFWFIEAKFHFLLIKRFVALLRILPLIVHNVNIMFISLIVLNTKNTENLKLERGELERVKEEKENSTTVKYAKRSNGSEPIYSQKTMCIRQKGVW